MTRPAKVYRPAVEISAWCGRLVPVFPASHCTQQTQLTTSIKSYSEGARSAASLSVLRRRRKCLIQSAIVLTDVTEQRGICNKPFGFGSLLSS